MASPSNPITVRSSKLFYIHEQVLSNQLLYSRRSESVTCVVTLIIDEASSRFHERYKRRISIERTTATQAHTF